MLWAIMIVLLVLWFLGLLCHVGGVMLLLLLVASVVLIFNLYSDRRKAF